MVALGLGSVVAAALVGLLDVRGAIIAAAVVLPLVGLAIVRPVKGWVAGAHVPERAFGLIRGLPLFAPLPIATLENLSLAHRAQYATGTERIVRQGKRATRST